MLVSFLIILNLIENHYFYKNLIYEKIFPFYFYSNYF